MGNIAALGNTVVQTTPVGVIEAFAGVNAPAGWLFCDGSAISRIQYPELFSALGTTYGSGDGSTTFNIPDLRGRMPFGKGTHSDVSALGNNEGASLANRRPKHQHTVYDAGHTHTNRMNGGFQVYRVNVAGGSGEYGITSANTGSIVDNSTNTTGVKVNPEGASSSTSPSDSPPYLVVNYIIKAVADLPRGGWFYQNQPPVVTQLPSNPQIGEEVYLYSAYGYTYQRYNGSAWDVISDNRKVIFTARGTSYQGAANGFYNFIFNTTDQNIGNAYNTANGAFTAPISGLYFFGLNARLDSTPSGAYLRTYVYRNGTTPHEAPNLHAIFGNNHATDYHTLSVSGLMYLTEGQVVYSGGGHVSGSSNLLRAESTFTGYLVK